jgi:hypothetical protein
LAILLPTLLLIAVPANAAGAEEGRSVSWLKETLDSTSEVRQSVSVIVDVNGFVHVSYYSGKTSTLMYETNDQQLWTSYQVDGQTGTGSYNSIDYGTNDNVVIAYYDSTNLNLKLATRADTGSAWQTSTLDSDGDVGKYCSVATDTDGNGAVSYYDSTNEKLKFFSTIGGNANIEVVDDMNPGSTSLSYFSNGTPVITYMDKGSYKLKYAMKSNGAWSYGYVNNVPVGDASSSHTDWQDNLHVAYFNASNAMLCYAKWTNGAWSYEFPDPDTPVSQSVSIRADVLGKAHISYYDAAHNDLKYATNLNGAWTNEILDATGNQGIKNAIGVDNYTKVHVVYVDSTNNLLNHITNSQATWDIETVTPSMVGAGENNSLAIDSNGVSHVAFSDPTNGSLYYANDDNGTWDIALVDVGGVGQNPSITVLDNGTIYISYYDFTKKQLKLAWNFGSGWYNDTVDSSNNVGKYSAIASMDEDIYVVYSDDGPGNLKWAVRKSGSWIINLLVDTNKVGPGLDMTMTADGNLHLAYFNDNQLNYGKYDGTNWNLAVVDNSFPCGVSVSIDVNANSQVFISYYVQDAGESGIRLAWGTTGNWKFEWVMPKDASGPGYSNALAFDSTGAPHVAFVNQAQPSTLGVSNFYYGLWSNGTLDFDAITGKVSADSDNSGRVHVVYYDSTNQTLKLATMVVVPTAPLSLTVLTGDSFVQLSWNAPTNDGGAPVTQYLISRGSSESTIRPYLTVTGTVYNDTGLVNDIPYYYTVKAINTEGASPASNQVSATPQGEGGEDPLDYTMIIIAAIAGVVIVAVVVLLLRRRG